MLAQIQGVRKQISPLSGRSFKLKLYKAWTQRGAWQLIHNQIKPLSNKEVCFSILFGFIELENMNLRHTLKIRTGSFLSDSSWGLPCSTVKLACIIVTGVAGYLLQALLSETGMFFFSNEALENAFSQVLQVYYTLRSTLHSK